MDSAEIMISLWTSVIGLAGVMQPVGRATLGRLPGGFREAAPSAWVRGEREWGEEGVNVAGFGGSEADDPCQTAVSDTASIGSPTG